jgi:hypothetical protein
MKDKKETPVSWLVEQFKKDIIGLEFDYKEEINQAIEMEKQQIMQAYFQGFSECDNAGICGPIKYYSETYEQ